MPQPAIWTFTQLGGNKEQKTLGGWSAPFGRPRNKTLVNAGVKMRTQTTYYTGKVEPTVHLFGSAPKPWELSGRFMDKVIGLLGGALTYRRQWYDFVEAGQIVRATWGSYLSYRMVLEDIDLDIEGPCDVAWRLKAIVLADEASSIATVDTPKQTPLDIASAMAVDMATVNTLSPSNLSLSQSLGSVLNLFSSISDTIDSTIAAINEPFAAVYTVCTAVSDFETALTSDLGKMTAGIQAMATGLINLRDSSEQLVQQAMQLDVPGADTPAGIFSGPDLISLTTTKIAVDQSTSNLLALIAAMQNQIDLTQRGDVASSYTAQGNDTWESIARRTLGSVDGARALKNLNGIRYGQLPVPGKVYTVPKRS